MCPHAHNITLHSPSGLIYCLSEATGVLINREHRHDRKVNSFIALLKYFKTNLHEGEERMLKDEILRFKNYK